MAYTLYTLLNDLTAGRCSNTAEVRLLRLWEARNINKGGRLAKQALLIRVTLHPHLNYRRFDRTIFNFPHSGFLGKDTDSGLTEKHIDLVFGFLNGASHMVRGDGGIHVSH
ncbi:unnamed protein product [Brassica oleracea]|uniref:25S rRNA (uridine-N(3))-methyltransferase BMT5-like domain-containing protein n=1 Tax=Brassica oleracea TaxID=3712 RepID=A0A3P6EFS7_BRAOL|nr:unnamed protein product [Brassica oleracea]